LGRAGGGSREGDQREDLVGDRRREVELLFPGDDQPRPVDADQVSVGLQFRF